MLSAALTFSDVTTVQSEEGVVKQNTFNSGKFAGFLVVGVVSALIGSRMSI